jgi:hypothetical protein
VSPQRKRLLGGIAPVIDLIRLQWWKRALRELSSRDPMHADIPRLVLMVHKLENATC